jgi:threonine/homoserine/homoserine lactone efflux protein
MKPPLMFNIILSMTIFAIIGAISPGPVNIIATGSGANFGFKRSLAYVIGTTVSYTLVVFLVGVGLNAVLEAYPQITRSLQYIGGAFLLYMSYKIATAKPVAISQKQETGLTNPDTPPSFLNGFLAQSLNPKAWLVSMSGVSLFVSANTPASFYLLIFCAISFTCCFLGVATWAMIGQLISAFLSTEKRQRLFNGIMGLLLSSTVFFIITAKL